MPRSRFIFVAALAICSWLSLKAMAEPHPADYPLRVHVFETRWHKHPGGDVGGEGRANLFERGQPRAFDYTFNCSQLFRASMGFETYPAKWRRSDAELEMLVPEMGKPGAFKECTLKVLMKNAAYYKHNGRLNEEPAAVFKEWMEKHNYDPERGKNEPTGLAAGPVKGSAKPN